MESHCRCEDHKDPAEREVRDNTSELRFEEGREDQLGRPKRDGDESPAGDITLENFKSTACPEGGGAETRWQRRGQLKKTNSWKMVRFQEPSLEKDVAERDSSAESLFPEYVVEEWTTISFEQLLLKEDWQHLTDDRLVRKKVLEPTGPSAPWPIWGQQVTVKMQAVLEDRTVVEKDAKLSFIIGEGDVSQALEECVLSMRKGEIALLLADSQYTYGLLGREPDIPAWAAMLYQLQLLDVRDKADPLNLPLSDRIRLGNHKRERGNFHFQRDEYGKAARAYCMALDVLTTCGQDAIGGAKEEAKEEAQEVRDYRVKCLNNLATAKLKLEKYNEALHASCDVLALDPNNVKALYRAGKILSDLGDYAEAMELLKRALKLEPATKAIHAELSKLVRRQSGGDREAKPAAVLGYNRAPFLLFPSKQTTLNISWKFILAALAVALGSLVTSVILTVRN